MRLKLFLLVLLIENIICIPVNENIYNISSTESKNNTTAIKKNNGVKDLVNNLLRLYDVVNDIMKPWFGSETETTTVTPIIQDITTEFKDFDEDEQEERKLDYDKASELFLRYIRNIDRVSSSNDNSNSDDIANKNNFIERSKRQVNNGPGVLFDILFNAFVNQGNKLWGHQLPILSRHIRDVWNLHGNNIIQQTYDIIQGKNTINNLLYTLMRHARDISEKVIGKNSTDVQEGRQNVFQGYYDFVINEYSYKFWAVYMLSAAALLTYSAVAAIYYAKFNTAAIDYELYDDIARSNSGSSYNPIGLVGSLVSVSTFQRIMEAITSKKYS